MSENREMLKLESVGISILGFMVACNLFFLILLFMVICLEVQASTSIQISYNFQLRNSD